VNTTTRAPPPYTLIVSQKKKRKKPKNDPLIPFDQQKTYSAEDKKV